MIYERFLSLANNYPDKVLFRWLDENGGESKKFTAIQLLQNVYGIAEHLKTVAKLNRGDRVLLCYIPSLDVIPALLACLMIGVVPVPIPPPNIQNLIHDLETLKNFISSCSPSAILTHSEYHRAKRVSSVFNFFKGCTWPNLPWIVTDSIGSLISPKEPFPELKSNDVAFLQYTSGSTSFPKGVEITHGNLQHQYRRYKEELLLGPDSTMVAWIPYFHDHCLIGGILSVAWGNGCFVLMSPVTFLKRPALWFEAISRFRATHTAGPNFGYELLMKKITPQEIKKLDLSSLVVIQSAAEPVRKNTMDKLKEMFKECGLRSDVPQASYGLAEHTVGVTLNGKKAIFVHQSSLEQGVIRLCSQDANDSASLYSCGTACDDVDLRIVNPNTLMEVPDLTVGEIWVDSDSKAQGYFRLSEESQKTFYAEMNNSDSTRKYLRTGDLGFMLEGELYVTGRLKELIIIRGRNVYPHDVEDSVRVCDPNIRPGGVAAFSSDVDHEEQLFVVVEVKEIKKVQLASVAKAVFQTVSTHHNILCAGVIVGASGTVIKTTSGKIKRKGTKEAFLKGLLPKPFKLNDLGEFSLKPPVSQPSQRELNPAFIPQDPAYKRTLKTLTSHFAQKSHASKSRVFHNTAVTAAGTIKIPSKIGLPTNKLFVPGTQYPVMVRVSNGVQDDDACIDNRGATVRILHPDFSEEYSHSIMDFMLVTGPCFMVNSAQSLLEWSLGPQAQQKMVKENPHWAASLWGTLKEPIDHTSYFYYSKVAYQFGEEESTSFVRFRLVPASRQDKGGVTPSSTLPPDTFSRKPDETRPKNFMKDKFKNDVQTSGVTFFLQAQVFPAQDASRDEILDATKEWPDKYAWNDIAELSLSKILANESVERLSFSPHNSHADFQIPIAATPTESASLGHARALTYWIASAARTGQSLPAELQEWSPKRPESSETQKPLRVAVVGGGVSGLTAAYELQKRGHKVTVFEKSDHVGGKSSSVEVEGKRYDLGAHFCSDVCESVKSLATEFNLPLESTTGVFTYDVEARQTVTPQLDPSKYKREYQTFAELKQKYFPDMSSPVMYKYGKTLHEPAKEWLQKYNLESIKTLISETYTSSGYGHYEDENLAALYVVKFLSMGILDTAIPNFWTIKDGFDTLWKAVGSKIHDVRIGVDVKVQRTNEEISIIANGATEKFDKLVLATPLHKSQEYLDASVEEADLFSRILYYDYWTVVCKISNVPTMGLYMLKQYCNDLPRSMTLGHCVAFHNRYPEGNIFTCYSYATPTMTREDIVKYLQEDIEKIGGNIEEICGVYKWDYFPHFKPDDLKEGIYERFDKLQGQQNTFYTGSIFNFELVECNASHTQALVRRITGESAVSPKTASTQQSKNDKQVKSEKEVVKKLSKKQLFEHVRKLVASELQFPESGLSESTQFTELGIDSLRAIQLTETLSTNLGVRLTATLFFEHPRIGSFVDFVMKEIHKGDSSFEDSSSLQQIQNIVFGESHGMGLMLDIFVPEVPSNGFAVLDVASSRFKSPKSAVSHRMVRGIYTGFCSKGFTVFAIRPGNSGSVTVGDMHNHIRQAIRWIADHSSDYSVDPYHIGISGLSAGGHLALLTALKSSVESCLIGGVTAFAPPTDLPGAEEDLENLFCLKRGQDLPSEETCKEFSPLWIADTLSPHQHIPPMLIFHAERDPEIPFLATEQFVEKLKRRGAQVELIARDSDQHEWNGMHKDAEDAAQWMLQCLEHRKTSPQKSEPNAGVFWTLPESAVTKYAERNRGLYGGSGTWTVYDLAHIAQLVEDDKPIFPEAAKILEDYALKGFPRSVDPKCNLLMAVSIAVALDSLRTKGISEATVQSAISLVLEEIEKSKVPFPTRNVGIVVVHHGFVGKMCDVFLSTPSLASHLTPQQQQYLASLWSFQRSSDEILHDMLDNKTNTLCEFIGDEKLRLESVRQHVHSMWPTSIPGQTAAFLAKYYGATKDDFALNILKDLMKNPTEGLVPHTILPCITFALYILLTSDAPVRKFLAEEISLIESGTKNGLSLLGYKESHPDLDCDLSSMVNTVRVKLGMPLAIPSKSFEQWWSDSEQCYTDAGFPLYAPENTLHVLEASLEASDLTRNEKLTLWKRSLASMRNCDKTYGAAHDSLFYTWWSIIRIFSKFSSEFPEAPTDLHHKVLDWLLACQTPSGGFFCAPFKEPNVAETAFALLSFKSALRSQDPYMNLVKPHLEIAALKAQQFILDHWNEDAKDEAEAWFGVLPMSSDLMSTAVILASLC